MSEKVQPREAAGGKASIYWVGAFGAAPTEVAEWRAKIEPASVNGRIMDWPSVEYREPKKRKWQRAPAELRGVTLVILDGWGHGGPKRFEEERSGGFVAQKSLYACFDPAWRTNYYDWLDNYLALHASADHASVKVLADYRGWGAA